MASRIAGVGVVTVSERRSMGFMRSSRSPRGRRPRAGRGAAARAGARMLPSAGVPPRPRTRPRTRAPAEERRARAAEIVDLLERAMPDVRIALEFGDDVQLLVSVILSAQSTDVGVNRATPALFARFPDAAAYAAAGPGGAGAPLRTPRP